MDIIPQGKCSKKKCAKSAEKNFKKIVAFNIDIFRTVKKIKKVIDIPD